MDFSWTFQTLVALFIGLAVGGFLGWWVTEQGHKQMAKSPEPPAVCSQCGKALRR